MENTKHNIIDAWIRVEQLSEGDIKTRDKGIGNFNELDGSNDFYTFFANKMEKERKYNRNFKDKSGFVIYCDVFKFEEVIEILRKKYNLSATQEQISYSTKFSIALYFNSRFEFNAEMIFFTVSAYIRYYKDFPDDFAEFESKYREKLEKIFSEVNGLPDQFNQAIEKVLLEYGIKKEQCYYRLVQNMETDATNLHSFFVEDLRKAKTISTKNLDRYFNGLPQKKRINLDSRKDSREFNPIVFKQILQPENYPLGRFPSNTKYALSFMQQVAVNLALHDTDNQMKSVNGPPGTGKTTLLKDIFADFVVQQACDICELADKKMNGTNETTYWDKATIGELPARIADKGIVVASSNNGAVQNIVNELPLVKDIDKELLNELLKADYFTQISNVKVHSEWIDAEGKKKEELVIEPLNSEDELKYWGLFSLEGGSSGNMSNIVTKMKLILKCLEEYEPNPEVYCEFEKLRNKVKKLRTEVQTAADRLEACSKKKSELKYLCGQYDENEALWKEKLEKIDTEINEKIKDCKRQMSYFEEEIEKNQARKSEIATEYEKQEAYLVNLRQKKPGLLARKEAKSEYQQKFANAEKMLEEFQNRRQALVLKIDDYQGQMDKLESKIREYTISRQEKHSDYEKKKNDIGARIAHCKGEITKLENRNLSKKIKALDMEQDYKELQLSSPWFLEDYRIAQSQLFIAALKVRKQFLYENKSNIKAALNIWNNQNANIGKENGKRLIAASWNWINMCIPVISTTFASLSRMCKNLEPETIGNLFVDEAGQALPQASIGGIYRSKSIMVVGDPFQIKPVFTLDAKILNLLARNYKVTEKYLSSEASTQTIIDDASQYGFYKSVDEWIGIPLWVHRRCQYPMFDISNEISYNGYMVQGNQEYGKADWYDVKGDANDKYVTSQGEFLKTKIQELLEKDPELKDNIYVITPFSNVAYQLAKLLREINFTKYKDGKPINVGTIHTFQGKEANIVFMVLGADHKSEKAAQWAVKEANMMNVAATRAKKEFYIIGDKQLYLGFGSDVAQTTYRIIELYKSAHSVEEQNAEENRAVNRMTGVITSVNPDKFEAESFYADIDGDDGVRYILTGKYYSQLPDAVNIVKKDTRISFIPIPQRKNIHVSDVVKI